MHFVFGSATQNESGQFCTRLGRSWSWRKGSCLSRSGCHHSDTTKAQTWETHRFLFLVDLECGHEYAMQHIFDDLCKSEGKKGERRGEEEEEEEEEEEDHSE